MPAHHRPRYARTPAAIAAGGGSGSPFRIQRPNSAKEPQLCGSQTPREQANPGVGERELEVEALLRCRARRRLLLDRVGHPRQRARQQHHVVPVGGAVFRRHLSALGSAVAEAGRPGRRLGGGGRVAGRPHRARRSHRDLDRLVQPVGEHAGPEEREEDPGTHPRDEDRDAARELELPCPLLRQRHAEEQAVPEPQMARAPDSAMTRRSRCRAPMPSS
mgnify:CR=1 FL=1